MGILGLAWYTHVGPPVLTGLVSPVVKCGSGAVVFPAVVSYEALGRRPCVVGGPEVVVWVLPCNAQAWCYLLVCSEGVCGRGAGILPSSDLLGSLELWIVAWV